MNPCAITAARVDTLLASVQRVVDKTRLVTTVESKGILVGNVQIPRVKGKTMRVVLLTKFTTVYFQGPFKNILLIGTHDA